MKNNSAYTMQFAPFFLFFLDLIFKILQLKLRDTTKKH